MRGKDHTGQVFGHLTVIGEAPKHVSIPQRRVFVRCVCGVEKDVNLPALVAGNTKSCGCKSSEAMKAHWVNERPAIKRTPTHAEVEAFLRYDPSTGRLFWKPRSAEYFPSQRSCDVWNAQWAEKQAGGFDKNGYVVIGIFSRCIRAHRLIYFMIHGEWPTEQIDHINGVKSDNRWRNLRPASSKGNQRNQTRPITNTSGIKGLVYDTRRGTWYFQMRRDDGSRYSKTGFLTKEAAAQECRRVREMLHGEFANHG